MPGASIQDLKKSDLSTQAGRETYRLLLLELFAEGKIGSVQLRDLSRLAYDASKENRATGNQKPKRISFQTITNREKADLFIEAREEAESAM